MYNFKSVTICCNSDFFYSIDIFFSFFRIENGKLELNVVYPGLTMMYSTDNGASWEKYDNPVEVKEDQDVLLITK